MPKIASRKFVLVSIDDDGDSKQAVRKLRRYLANHKMKSVFSSSPDEMKEFLDKLHSNTLVFDDNCNISEEPDDLIEHDQPTINNSTNQEILEQWAREAFSGGSDALQLLFGVPIVGQEKSAEEFNHQELERETDNSLVSTMPPVEQEISREKTVENDEQEKLNMVNCMLCGCEVGIGRNRNTRIKRQAQHVKDKHLEDAFRSVEISKRYHCLQCDRTLPVSKSPCEHISEYHNRNKTDTELRDLWTKNQLEVFNSILQKCFNRHLPVPKSRRIRENVVDLAPKASYRIVQDDEVLQINTVVEKLHPGVEKNPKTELNSEEGAGVSNTIFYEDDPTEDDDLYDHLYEIDSEDCDISMRNIDNDE